MLSISYTSICSKLIDKAITCHKVKQQVFHSSSVVFKISQIFRFGVVQTVDSLVCVTYVTKDTAFSFSSHSFMICTHSDGSKSWIEFTFFFEPLRSILFRAREQVNRSLENNRNRSEPLKKKTGVDIRLYADRHGGKLTIWF